MKSHITLDEQLVNERDELIKENEAMERENNAMRGANDFLRQELGRHREGDEQMAGNGWDSTIQLSIRIAALEEEETKINWRREEICIRRQKLVERREELHELMDLDADSLRERINSLRDEANDKTKQLYELNRIQAERDRYNAREGDNGAQDI